MRDHRSNSSGFTFLEIVTALAILAIGILAVITLFPIGLENSKRATERTHAATLVYSQLQYYRATGYIYVANRLANAARLYSPFWNQERYFLRWVSVEPYTGPGVTATNIRQVNVTAYWPAWKTTEPKPPNRRSLSMSTLIAER